MALTDQKVVLLVGGVGGAKFAYGLYHILPPENLTIIVNTGDDFWHYGLRICPDLDTITYTLADLVDKQNGWGIGGDTTVTLDALRRLGENTWFRLGDQDIATHLLRTQLWREGVPLTEITRQITSNLGIQCAILPMSDTSVATIVHTEEEAELEFQVYFVKHRWQPTVKSIEFRGAEKATVTAQIEQAIAEADILIVGPSNPWLSISPILSVPGMRDLLRSRDIPRVVITPIVSGKAIKGPTAKIMQELGYTISAEAVLYYYKDVVNMFVADERDRELDIQHTTTVYFDTIMDTEEKRIRLATQVLNWLKEQK